MRRSDSKTQFATDTYQLITQGKGAFFQHHTPEAFRKPFHAHPSLEINFLHGCEMEYSFGGRSVHIPSNQFCIFWAAQPHRVINVMGTGKITNAYISLVEFWSWPLPTEFVDALLAGAVVVGKDKLKSDTTLAERFANEIHSDTDRMNRLHCLELQARITRLALTGWKVISDPPSDQRATRLGGKAVVHFEKMLRHIAIHYADPIRLSEVAAAAGVSDNYANTLFKKIIGTTVKAHITTVRIYRARMLLAETDAKIISIALDCGFRSLSSFYEAFNRYVGISPAEFRTKVERG